MKILIFGGGGFIGSAIADRLLQDSHELIVFERPGVERYRIFNADEKMEWIAGDFSSAKDVGDVMQGVDVVLHLVSTTLPKNSNEDPIFDVQSNVVATLQMLNAMVANKIPKIVFISSGGTVYGPPTYLPIDEMHPTNPVVSYGVAKLAIEKYLHVYERMYGINSLVLRVSNPYGERQRVETAQGAVGVFMHHVLKGISIDIWGDGSVTRDYIYVGDVVEAFIKALEYTGDKRVFNISSGVGTSLNDLISMLENTFDCHIERRYLPGREFDVPVNVLSNNLARIELGWVPAVSMSLGIKRTATWLIEKLGFNDFSF